MQKKTLAIFSPNEYAYSETFIKAHKKLAFNIKYYTHGWVPTKLEGAGSLDEFKLIPRIKKRFDPKFNLSEHGLTNSLKKEKVDCILAEYFLSAGKNLKVIKSLKLPLVVHFHGYDATYKPDLEQYAALYKEVFAYAFAVVAVSNKMREDLLALGCPASKLYVAIYGPDPAFLKLEPAYNSPQFIAVGRFIDKKAPYHTIAAFKKVVVEFPAAKLVMVGDGPLLDTCKNLVRVWHLKDNVVFKGVLKPDEIQNEMQASLAFVQHSVITESGDSEGAPVAVLEAQAAGLPVISTYHAGIPDIVINNETGLLVTEHDVDGMADKMLLVLQKKGLASKLGIAGRKRIIENFTREKNLLQLQGIIENVFTRV